MLAIAFHPRDDRFFLAGARDARLRLWSIPDKRVEYFSNVGDIVSAVSFSPDGKTAMAGTMSGTVSLFATEGLKQMSQFTVRGKKKSRVTGIESRYIPSESDIIKILVTSADSRVRVYNFRDKALEIKLKAHKAEEIPIRASFSDDGKYVVSGSEDKGVYIWSVSDTNVAPVPEKDRDKAVQRPLEHFEANAAKTTCAIIAPRETRIALSMSGDPIYDICNPPPVKLIEREDSIASSTKMPEANTTQHNRSHSKQTLPDMRKDTASTFDFDPAKNSTYLARCSHPTGAIIVTASTAGIIRIYRQDCAWKKRSTLNSISPESSTARRLHLRRAIASSRSSVSAPNTPRPGSVRTNGSGNNGFGQPKSYATSVKSFKSTTGAGPATPSIKSIGASPATERTFTTAKDGRGGNLVARSRRSESVSSQPSRDRIEMWRADVDGRQGSTTSLRTVESSAKGSAAGGNARLTGSPSSRATAASDGGAMQLKSGTVDAADQRPKPESRGSSFANPLRLQGGSRLCSGTSRSTRGSRTRKLRSRQRRLYGPAKRVVRQADSRARKKMLPRVRVNATMMMGFDLVRLRMRNRAKTSKTRRNAPSAVGRWLRRARRPKAGALERGVRRGYVSRAVGRTKMLLRNEG